MSFEVPKTLMVHIKSELWKNATSCISIGQKGTSHTNFRVLLMILNYAINNWDWLSRVFGPFLRHLATLTFLHSERPLGSVLEAIRPSGSWSSGATWRPAGMCHFDASTLHREAAECWERAPSSRGNLCTYFTLEWFCLLPNHEKLRQPGD